MKKTKTNFKIIDSPSSEDILYKSPSIVSILDVTNTKAITGYENGQLVISDIKTKKNNTLQFQKCPITSVSKVQGDTVVIGNAMGELMVISIRGNKMINSFTESKDAITNIIYNNPHNVFLSSSLDQTLKVYKVSSDRSLNTLKERFPITTFDWLNSLAVTGNLNGEINIYDINTNQQIYSKKLFNNNTSSIFIDIKSGSIISTSKNDGNLSVIDMRMNSSIFNSRIHQSGINYLGVDENGLVITGSGDGTIKVNSMIQGFKEIGSMKGSDKVVNGDLIDGFFCVGCADGCLLGYDLATMKCIFGYTADEKGKVKFSKIVPEAKCIITGGDEGVIRKLIF